MLRLIAEGVRLGLSTGPVCAVTCVPVLLPIILGEERRRFLTNVWVLVEFMVGRLIAYVLFGVALGWLGGVQRPDDPRAIAAMATAKIGLGLALLLFAARDRTQPREACSRFHRFLGHVRFPFVAGFLVGISICPPFVAAGARVLELGGAMLGALYFVAFFVGTSVYLVPLIIFGLGNLYHALRSIGKLLCALTGMFFLTAGAAVLLARPAQMPEDRFEDAVQQEDRTEPRRGDRPRRPEHDKTRPVQMPRNTFEDAALQQVLPKAKRFGPKCDDPPRRRGYDEAGRLVGFVFVTEEVAPGIRGHGGPVPLRVGMDVSGRIVGLKLLQNNESPEFLDLLREEKFVDQFPGKRHRDPLTIGKDINAVTGATMTCSAICRGVREAARKVAVAETQAERAGPRRQDQPRQPERDEARAASERRLLRLVLPQAVRFGPESDGPPRRRGYDEAGRLVGFVFVTEEVAPGIRGYRGPVPVRVGMDVSGRIVGLKLLQNNETPQNIDQIHNERFLDQFHGKLHSDPLAIGEDIDGVTSATVTCDAICRGVREAAGKVATAELAAAPPPEAPGSKWGGILMDPLNYAIILLFAWAIVASRTRWRRYRAETLVLSIAVLGFWGKRLFSVQHVVDIFTWQLPPPADQFAWYLLAVGAIGTSFFFGRLYCGWLCPFGALTEFIGAAARRLGLSLKPSPRVTRPLHPIKYVVLVASPVLYLVGGAAALSFEPFFDTFTLSFLKEGGLSLRWIWLIFLATASMVHIRFYCKYICPAGACLAFVTRRRLRRSQSLPKSPSCTACSKPCGNGAAPSPPRDSQAGVQGDGPNETPEDS